MNGEGWKIFRHKERAHSQASEKQRMLKMEGQNQEKKKKIKALYKTTHTHICNFKQDYLHVELFFKVIDYF